MNAKSTVALLALLTALSAPQLAAAGSGNATTLLNGASQMNQEEQAAATMLRNKAGDNQAMITTADTISGDHKANQEAVKALADSRKITLKDYKKDDAANDQMSKLNGAKFNSAFLAMDVRDHNGAIETFKTARSTFKGDRDIELYIDETLPVLKAHLEMAKTMQRAAALGSSQNPANNRTSRK
jgi:predicted outer membrane protein